MMRLSLLAFAAVMCSVPFDASGHATEYGITGRELEDILAHYRNYTDAHPNEAKALGLYEEEETDDRALQQATDNHDLGPGWPVDKHSYEKTANMMNQADKKRSRSNFPTLIQPVSFINFIKQDGTGRNTYQAFQQQIDQLNAAYSASEAKGRYSSPTDARIRFKLAGVRYVVNDNYFNYCALPTIMAQSRPLYMMDGAIHMNIYVCYAQLQLGLSWLPYDSFFGMPTPESHYALGAIVHYQLLPGNTFHGGLWSKGNILTHEVGHFYGLRHPYQGDCIGTEMNSDQIADTPRMTGNPLATCAAVAGRDSCKGFPGKDDMSTYMVATADTCRNHFTPGQVDYMQAVIQQYKPTLMKQLPPSCVASVDSSDNSPDLQPCLDGTVRTSNGRQWCRTDPIDKSVWAWACCPTNLDWDQDQCRQGTPNFSTPNNGPSAPNVVVAQAPKKKSKTLRE